MTGRCPVEAHLAHLELRGLSPATITARRAHLRRLARHLGVDLGEELLLATSQDLEGWQQTMVKLSINYRIAATVHLREFYRYAVRFAYIDVDPSRDLIAPRQRTRVPQPIDGHDLDLAIADASPRVRAMLVLAAYCGLRAVEIAGLTREQVRDDLAAPVLVVIGKGNKQRVIPLPQMVIDELRRYGLPSTGHVFLRGDGLPGPTTPSRVSQVCGGHLHRLGIPASLHKLRHYYGTAMYAASRDIVMVQNVMGHTSPSTTSGYVAFDRDGAQAASTAIAADSGTRTPPRARLQAVPDDAQAPLTVREGMGGPAGRGELTQRERETLLLMAQGLTNPQIARELGLSVHTVRVYTANVLRRTGATTRAGAVSVALQTGLVA